MSSYHGVEAFEPRWLFALDLAPVLTVHSTFALSIPAHDGQLVYDLAIANHGTSTFDGDVPFKLVLSKDNVVGNRDDLRLDDIAEPDEPIPPGTSVPFTNLPGVIPSGLIGGKYYLGIILDADHTIAESNVANNSTISSKNAVTIVTSQLLDSMHGTDGDDQIVVTQPLQDSFVTLNGKTYGAGVFHEDAFSINGQLGNDDIRAFPDVQLPLVISGAGGNDTLVGGGEDDTLSGGNGKDKLYGNNGDDLLVGGANPDTLDGMAGDDTSSGGGGNDRLLAVSQGRDYLTGGIGNDVLITNDKEIGDTLSGGAGSDSGLFDQGDEPHSIEDILA